MASFEERVLSQIADRVRLHWPSADVRLLPDEYNAGGLMLRTRVNAAVVLDLVNDTRAWFAVPVASNAVRTSPLSERRPYNLRLRSNAKPVLVADTYYGEIRTLHEQSAELAAIEAELATNPEYSDMFAFGDEASKILGDGEWIDVVAFPGMDEGVVDVLLQVGGNEIAEGCSSWLIVREGKWFYQPFDSAPQDAVDTGVEVRGGPAALAVLIAILTGDITDREFDEDDDFEMAFVGRPILAARARASQLLEQWRTSPSVYVRSLANSV